jgi:hypothetical protein
VKTRLNRRSRTFGLALALHVVSQTSPNSVFCFCAYIVVILTFSQQTQQTQQTQAHITMEGIHWSCVSRNETILVEAGEDNLDGQVTKIAQEVMRKKPTPGWEFHRPLRSPLHGVKFHVYEKDDSCNLLTIWTFCCVYDKSSIQLDQAQSFLEKIVALTQIQREEEYRWRHDDTPLAAQESFAPILLQRMEEVSYMGRMAMVNEKVDGVKMQMANNIDLILERGEKLEDLNEEATRLEDLARAFKKSAKKLKRIQMWQNAKHGLVVGTVVTAGVTVLVVPPLVALL